MQLGRFFKRFRPKNLENFDFSTKFQMAQNGIQVPQITLKTLFSDSGRLDPFSGQHIDTNIRRRSDTQLQGIKTCLRVL